MDKKMKVKIGIGAAIAVVAVLLVLSGKKKGQQGPVGMGQEAAATIVKAQKPSVGDISLTTGLTGTVEPSDVVYVYAKASGDVTSVLVKAGDMVEQGQVLCVRLIRSRWRLPGIPWIPRPYPFPRPRAI